VLWRVWAGSPAPGLEKKRDRFDRQLTSEFGPGNRDVELHGRRLLGLYERNGTLSADARSVALGGQSDADDGVGRKL